MQVTDSEQSISSSRKFWK